MAVVDRRSSALPVPYAMEFPDRARKERYFDPAFYQLEAERLWSRVWQMACRLEEIPEPRDFAEYEILDQSVVVVRTEDGGVSAFQNACRHRGVKVVQGQGTCETGFICPFHGWCYGPDGQNTFVPRKKTFAEHNVQPQDLDLTPVRCEVWGGCAWINLDDDAPPLRQCIEPFATIMEAWRIESMRVEWWYACRLPVNWKLAEEAFMEQYHVVEAHPQLVIPGRDPSRGDGTGDPRTLIDAEIHYLRTMSEGMAGMVHANDVRIAEGLRDTIELPADPDVGDVDLASGAQRSGRALASGRRQRHPRPQRSRGTGAERADGLLLPAPFRPAHVQQRLLLPLPTAGTGGDADGDLVAHAVPGRR